MSPLPPELVDHIFSFLDVPHDTRALCASCLVCTAWLPIAREHLFATLRTREGQTKSARSLVDFVRLLAAPSCGVGPAVTRLVVDGGLGDTKLPFAAFLAALAALPRLRHVVLANVRLPGALPDAATCGAHAVALRSLTLSNVGFYLDSPALVFRLLHAFAALGALTLERVWFRYAYGTPPAPLLAALPLPPRLTARALALHHADDRVALLLRALARSPLAAALRALHVAFYDLAPLLPPLAAFLRACPSLRHLTLDLARSLPCAHWAAAVPAPLALPALPALASAELRTGAVPRAAAPFWAAALALLSALPPRLAALRLRATAGRWGFAAPALGAALRRFTALRRVVVVGLRDAAVRAEVARAVARPGVCVVFLEDEAEDVYGGALGV